MPSFTLVGNSEPSGHFLQDVADLAAEMYAPSEGGWGEGEKATADMFLFFQVSVPSPIGSSHDTLSTSVKQPVYLLC